ncbi:hypothetical protein B0A52_06396 [Exophiala mesophila]|uniref:Zn(2)-C6 fungal-type domain-containing protein n=1 Tax=Exophiala mesophila TaxID=212818 RepID=A0A438N200_EXOME|nr:hypothetical protein B0A52_06396 [Exophiala mesophila]
MTLQESNSLVAHEQRLRGRTRGIQACDQCRASKRKCDGGRPVCGTCAKRPSRVACIYEKPASRKSRTTRRIELLETRIAELSKAQLGGDDDLSNEPGFSNDAETLAPTTAQVFSPSVYQTLDSFPGFQDPEISSFNNLPPALSSAEGGWKGEQTTSAKVERRLGGIRVTPISSDEHENEKESDRIDGMGLVAGDMTDIASLDAEQIGYFGRSSTINFVGHVQSILGASSPRPDETSPYSTDDMLSHNRRRHPEYPEEYVIPPRKEADNFLRSFWVNVHPLYPFIDRVEFDRHYEEIWSADSTENSNPSYEYSDPLFWPRSTISKPDKIPESRRFHILLNIMMALGCHCDDSGPIADVATRSHLFWLRAKGLLERDFDVFNRPRVQFIQALLLIAVLSQGLGIPSSAKSESVRLRRLLETEGNTDYVATLTSRWRIWAGCVIVDRTLATTYGRPAMISRSAADISICGFNAEMNEGLGSQQDPQIRSLIYMNEMLKLHEVLDCVTVKYSKSCGDQDLEMDPTNRAAEKSVFTGRSLICQIERGDFDDLLHSDAALSGWESETPPGMKMPCAHELHPGTAFDPRIDRQVVALRARYLYGRVLTFRPLLLQKMARHRERVLEKRHQQTVSSILTKALVEQGPGLCVDAAEELVATMAWVHQHNIKAAIEPWYTVFYMYTCAMILLVDRLCQADNSRTERTINIWNSCLEVLDRYQAKSRTARRCVKLLKLSEESFFAATRAAGQDTAAPAIPLANIQRNESTKFDAGAGQNFYQQLDVSEISHPDLIDPRESQNVGESWSSHWTDDQIDLAWLGTLPFDLDFDERSGALW